MEFASVIVIVFLIAVSVLVTAMIIRYAIDSSRTSRVLVELHEEVRLIRKELRKREDRKHIIDERI